MTNVQMTTVIADHMSDRPQAVTHTLSSNRFEVEIWALKQICNLLGKDTFCDLKATSAVGSSSTARSNVSLHWSCGSSVQVGLE